jgi:spore coat protein U-like protein
MKINSKSILLTVCAVIAIGIGNTAFATTATSNMSVFANVSGDCTIAANPLGFGSYDPVTANSLSGSDAMTATNLFVTCTANSSATITLGQGLNPATGSSDDTPLRRIPQLLPVSGRRL